MPRWEKDLFVRRGKTKVVMHGRIPHQRISAPTLEGGTITDGGSINPSFTDYFDFDSDSAEVAIKNGGPLLAGIAAALLGADQSRRQSGHITASRVRSDNIADVALALKRFASRTQMGP